jgi:hypothetical protein
MVAVTIRQACTGREMPVVGDVTEATMKDCTLWTRVALTCALAAGLTLTLGNAARADDFKDECHRKLEADRARIDRDAARHGEQSHQVAHDVAKMDETRRWCRDHKADWDHDRFDIGVYFHH